MKPWVLSKTIVDCADWPLIAKKVYSYNVYNLGPVLFLLYVNDITSSIQSQVRLFEDNCLIYRTINSKCDHKILQNDLDCLASWASKWQMEFNVTKYKFQNA